MNWDGMNWNGRHRQTTLKILVVWAMDNLNCSHILPKCTEMIQNVFRPLHPTRKRSTVFDTERAIRKVSFG